MIIDVLTLFPEMFPGFVNTSILKRAVDNHLVVINTHNFREFARDRHHTVDDTPYGGGSGMVLKPEPIFEAVEALQPAGAPVIMLSPQGRLFTQAVAQELSKYDRIVLVCGRYEGVDERVREHLATDEISIGDYVLSGGELPSMVIIEAVVRLLPGVLGSEESALDDSHVAGLLEYPQYTRPPVFREWAVPEVLLSGNHAGIAKWRKEQSIRRTTERRPDLMAKAETGLQAGNLPGKTREK
ncbi:MAG: tRNA (guanosine(37)-N1)-methyltransferase TrmD [Dehalococcoidales bacterium]|nr:tRNA (guanosine(37)-N1)-methyltransferase TrmD [Dehalococcoidales bacterium]